MDELSKGLIYGIVVVGCALTACTLSDIEMESHMAAKSDQYKIIERNESSELQNFARWFHQDWKLVYSDFFEGAKIYFESLPPNRKKMLRKELATFIEENADTNSKQLLQLWLRLGAQGWQADLEILPTLKQFLRLM